MEAPILSSEFEYYLANQDALVNLYEGRFVVITDHELIGDYATILEAYQETKKSHELGTFLIQLVEPGEEGYTQTFHSRVFV
jgi:hypothetical protein